MTIRLKTMMALFLAMGGAANAQTRIAYSDRLGVEIMADSPAWCVDRPAFKAVAKSSAMFASNEFAILIQRFATSAVARDCPAARALDVTGLVAGQDKPVWHGLALAANNWAIAPVAPPIVSASTDLDAPPVKPSPAAIPAAIPAAAPPPPPATEPPLAASPAAAPANTAATPPAPTAPPPRPGAGTPLFGEWSGRMTCSSNDPFTITLSVYEVIDSHFQAVVEVQPDPDRANAGQSRMMVAGVIDTVSGQINWTTKRVVRANRDNWSTIRGMLAPGGTMSLQPCPYGSGTMTQIGPSPMLADRVLADAERRRTMVADALARPHPGRLVGDQPQQPARQPACEELLAWAQSAPLDLRVTIVGGFSAGSPGMLRQYDDAHSAPVFGAPLYWLFKSSFGNAPGRSLDIDKVVDRACSSQQWNRDPRYRTLVTVANDGASQSQLGTRHLADDLADRLPVEIATTGGTAVETYRDLSALTDPAKLETAFAALTRLNGNILSDANKLQIVADAKRLRDGLATHALDDLRAELVALPDTAQGLERARAITDRAKATFAGGATAPPALADAIDASGTARREAIADAMLAHAQSGIAATPHTLAGLHQAAALAQAAVPLIQPLRPDGSAKLQDSLNQHAAQAWPAVLDTETKAVGSAPPTLESLQQLVARRAELVTLAGAAAPDGFGRYLAAIDAKAQDVGTSAKAPLKQRLAALQPTWPDVASARQQANAAADPFGDTQVGKDLRAMGEARVAELLPPLADAALATVRASPAKGLDQIAWLAFQAEEAAAPFRADKAGAAQADRIAKTLRQDSADKAYENLKPYTETLRAAPASRPMALRMAHAAVLLDRAVVRVPGFTAYRDATRDAAVRMYAAACTQAAADGNIASNDAGKPMLVGRTIATLGSFLCDIREAGIKAGSLEKPSFFSSASDSVLKLYVPESAAGLAIANTAARLQETLMGRAPPAARDADPFDFSAEPQTGNATAAAPIVSVQRIVLRDVEVSPGQRAWVGVQLGDEAKMEAMSIPQWREASEQMASLARGAAADPTTCATFRRKPADLDPSIAAQALLTCPTRP